MQVGALVSDKMKRLYFRVLGNSAELQKIAERLEWLTFHFPSGKLESALEWLIRNGQTGKRFLDFVQFECASSNLELQRRLLMELEKTKEYRRLHAVKDFRQ